MKGGGCNHFIAAPEPSTEDCELVVFLLSIGIEAASDMEWVKEKFETITLAQLREDAEDFEPHQKLDFAKSLSSHYTLTKVDSRLLARALVDQKRSRDHT